MGGQTKSVREFQEWAIFPPKSNKLPLRMFSYKPATQRIMFTCIQHCDLIFLTRVYLYSVIILIIIIIIIIIYFISVISSNKAMHSVLTNRGH